MKRTINDFENAHGMGRIHDLTQRIAIEKAKVEALASVQNKISVENCEDNYLKFAITGDRHTGSLYEHNSALKAFYDHCEKEGIKRVYDAGDILDGHKIYKGQEFELRDHGFEAQLNRLKEAPRNIETYFITGNHDGSFKSAAGIAVGQAIEAVIPEYHFIGEDQATVQFNTPNGTFTLGLMHPGGGSSYAISYRPQKIVESLEGGSKPDLLCIGHYHKAEMIPSYRNVCALSTGTFQKQTPFMMKGALAAHVGGWIVEIWVGKSHKRFRTEFVAFYA
jgi:DNA repair exonuclease SbcCD nuclease subunit